MNRNSLTLVAILCMVLVHSCKDKSTADTPLLDKETLDSTVVNKVAKKVVTEEEKKAISSVQSKVMVTPELHTFARATVTASLTNLLSQDDGPFTVFAPSDDAFNLLSKEKMNQLMNPSNKPKLSMLLKNHVVKGNHSSADLVQSLKKTDSLKLSTLGGATLTASRNGMDITITDAGGNVSKVGKSDIVAGNGVVHILDKVLNMN